MNHCSPPKPVSAFKQHGATLIELIIAMAIAAIVLALVSGYLAQSSDTTRRNQSTSEVQDRVRMVMQLLTQDLNQVGSSRYATSDNNSISPLEATCPVEECLKLEPVNGYQLMQIKYVTSLSTQSQACHRVRYNYGIEENTIWRSDVADASCNTESGWGQVLAKDILALDVQYLCSDGDIIDAYPHNNCPADGTAYPRSAMLTVVARSTTKVMGTASKTYTTVKGNTITCPADYVCYAMSQEVQMPNLKDR